MNDRLSRLIAAWLAHNTGITQAVLITAAWGLTPWVFGWSTMSVVFWYLALCTFISFATQFTLAYQNKRAEIALELALRNITDLMRLTVALAKEIQDDQEDLLEDLAEFLDPDKTIEKAQEAVVGSLDPPLLDETPLGETLGETHGRAAAADREIIAEPEPP